MNLLRKYYDGLADLPTGGGIPDEVRRKIEEKASSIEVAGSRYTKNHFGNLWFERRDKYIYGAQFGYSLASEEISRLKEDINIFMGDGEHNYVSTEDLHAEFNKKGIQLSSDADGSDADNIASAVKGLLNKLEDTIEELKDENERLRAEGWNDYATNKPPLGIEVIAQSEHWVDEDFNPKGVRIGFQNEDNDGPFITAKWNNYQDFYDTIESSKPTKWKHI